MKILNNNYVIKLVLLFILPLLAFGFYSKKGEVLKVNNSLYLSNTVVIKLRTAPLTKSNQNIQLTDKVNQVMNQFNLTSSKPFLMNNNTGTGLDRIIIVKYS